MCCLCHFMQWGDPTQTTTGPSEAKSVCSNKHTFPDRQACTQKKKNNLDILSIHLRNTAEQTLQLQSYAAENVLQFKAQSYVLQGNPLIPNYRKITNDNDNIMNYRTFMTSLHNFLLWIKTCKDSWVTLACLLGEGGELWNCVLFVLWQWCKFLCLPCFCEVGAKNILILWHFLAYFYLCWQ